MQLTKEQQIIFDKVQETLNKYTEPTVSTDNIIFVDASAGTGKTTLSKYIIENIPNISVQYIAYNKTIVEEFKEKTKFINNCKSNTSHSLAYKYIMTYNNYQITNFFPLFNKRIFNYKDSLIYRFFIQDLYEGWLVSSYTTVKDYIENIDVESSTELIQSEFKAINKNKYIELLEYIRHLTLTKEIDITHNGYLKEFQLALEENKYNINVDLLILDECNDLNPVTFKIVELIKARCKLLVGDRLQEIYQFNGTINAFNTYANKNNTYKLSSSFRCSPEVATIARELIQEYLDKDFNFIGINTEPPNNNAVFICRTNSQLITLSLFMITNHIHFRYTKDMSELFKTLIGISNYINDKDILKNKVSFKIKNVIDNYKNKKFGSIMVNKFNYKFVLEKIEDLLSRHVCNRPKQNLLELIDMIRENNDFTDLDKVELEALMTSLNFDELFPSLQTYVDLYAYSQNDATLIKIAIITGSQNLAKINEYASKTENNSSIKYILSTAHSIKGMEYDNVILHYSFIEQFKQESPNPAEIMLTYVAITRAKNKIIIAKDKNDLEHIATHFIEEITEEII
jgi:superfamily I DNA/RNA helicase